MFPASMKTHFIDLLPMTKCHKDLFKFDSVLIFVFCKAVFYGKTLQKAKTIF